MEYSLQGYFDLGVSYGLGDNVFKHSGAAEFPEIYGIGLPNRLGVGLLHNIDQDHCIVRQWRKEAARKIEDPVMELGYDYLLSRDAGSEMEFKQELRQLVESHPIQLCHLTIYAIGVVFFRLDFARGIPSNLLQGFAHCFEYAGYLEPVSTALLNAARRAADAALKPSARKWSLGAWMGRRGVGVGIQRLTRRPDPDIQIDQTGLKESRLFTSFTHVAMCVDKDDDVEEVRRSVLPTRYADGAPDSEAIHFEYHGVIHFNWAACVLEPKSFDSSADSPKGQIQRMLLCIQIAHSYHGVYEAFQRLFFYETFRQADGYISGLRVGRSYIELNRLRVLALAAVSLCNLRTYQHLRKIAHTLWPTQSSPDWMICENQSWNKLVFCLMYKTQNKLDAN
jgi:hypothetical protein